MKLTPYQVTVKYPNSPRLGHCVNWNTSPECAIAQIRLGIGMENDKEYVDSCEIVKVEEVMRDPNNKYGYIPVNKEGK